MILKICHVGCGNMSVRYYGPSYFTYLENYPDTEFLACCDLNESQAKMFSSMLGFDRYYKKLDDMLKNEDPDVVVVVVDEKLIANLATQIMKNGYNVIMEKPPGINPEELRGLIDVANKQNVATQVNFNRRFMPIILKLKELIRDRYNKNEVKYIRYDFWRVQRREPDFYMTAIHGIDTVRFILDDDFDFLNFSYQKIPEMNNSFENYYLDGLMKSGIKVSINFIVNAGLMVERCLIQAHDETVFCNLPVWGGIDVPGNIQIYRNSKIAVEIGGAELLSHIDEPEEPHYMGFYEQLRTGFEDIRAGKRPENDLSKFQQSLEIAHAMHLKKQNYRSGH
ncbi:MAG: Gfo/Idh/MocA family protein [Promethearchaeota archaeon]